MLESQRLKIMDEQRFDLSKRLRPRLSIHAQSTVAEDPTSVKNPPLPSSRPRTVNPLAGGVWKHYGRVFVPIDIASTTSSNSDGDFTSVTSVSTPSTNPSSTDSAPIAQNNPTELRRLDVYDNGEFSSMRTVIRPMPRSPTLGFCSAFSCSSSPFSRPSSPCSPQSNSLMNLSLGSLSCFSSTQNFELDLNTMLQKEQIQPSEIQVVVSEEVTVQREELWRESVQQVLYGHGQDYDTR